MADENRKDKQLPADGQTERAGHIMPDEAELGAAGKSLSEALRISFAILKVIMVILVIIFLASGFRTIGPDEKALVLRFGKIQGAGEGRILGPGLKWVFPYPIDEIVKIPVAKKINLAVDSFWYADEKRVPQFLDPLIDGYCLTRSQTTSGESDYSIIHSKWQLTYQIDDPERFFKNLYIKTPMPGETFADIIPESLEALLTNLVENAVVTAMVDYTIDEIMFEKVAKVTEHVKRLLQQNLDKSFSGIKVVSVQLTNTIWPRQVHTAFLDSIKASQESQKTISEAKSYYENTLNEVAGPVADKLLEAAHGKSVTAEQRAQLWSLLAGTAQERIADARAYRRKVVETAKANAEYLEKILPQYRERPQLVIQNIYEDAIEYVLENTDEKMIIQPTEGTQGKEIRIQLSRDPKLKPRIEREK